MNDARPFDDRDALASLDRLAAGELDDGPRRALFAWLDREPSRWRRCALVLLETREWESALEDWTAEVGAKAPRANRPRPRTDSDGRALTRRPTVPFTARFAPMKALAAAAAIAAAFGLGMAADRQWLGERESAGEVASAIKIQGANIQGAVKRQEAAPSAPRAGGHSARPSKAQSTGDAAVALASRQPANAASRVGALADESSSSDGSRLVPDYVKSQLERRGYRVDSRRQFVSVSLPSGRRVTLPVERWNLSYVGNRVY
jgi:hypothetical protein